MRGFALIRTDEGLKKVPHESDDATGKVPQLTKDGEEVWNWTSSEASADALIERRAAFKERGQNRNKQESTERKTPPRKEGK